MLAWINGGKIPLKFIISSLVGITRLARQQLKILPLCMSLPGPINREGNIKNNKK